MGKDVVDLSLIKFRPITQEDTEFNYRVYYSTREEELAKSGWTEEEKANFVRMQFNLQNTQYTQYYKGATFEVISLDGTPVGRLFLHETSLELRIMDIAILPEFRNKGIGTKILNDLVHGAHSRNKTLSIHVEIYNPAQKLYERLGFIRSETRGMYYFMECFPPQQT